MSERNQNNVVLHRLEEVCRRFKVCPTPEDLKWLEQFRTQKNPFGTCQHILASSQMPHAQSEALQAIHDALLREWAGFQGKQIEDMRNELFSFGIAQVASLHGTVIRKLVHVVSVVFKRGWFPDQRKSSETLLSQLTQLLGSSPEKQYVGLLFCKALIPEFRAGSSSTNLGAPWDYHVKCHRSFEDLVLKRIFGSVVSALQVIIQAKDRDDRTFGNALGVINEILDWEFHEKVSDGKLLLRSFAEEEESRRSSTKIRPGPAWRDVFLNSQFVELIFEIHPHITSLSQGRIVREILIQLASIDGKIFKIKDEKIQYFSRLAKLTLLVSDFSIKRDRGADWDHEQELVGFCALFQRLILNFKFEAVLRLEDPRSFLGRITQMLCVCIDGLTWDALCGHECAGSWAGSCLDILLDSWVILTAPVERKIRNDQKILGLLQEFSTPLFQKYFEKRLLLAKDEAESSEEYEGQFHDSVYMEDHLTSVAYIGRMNPSHSLNILRTAFLERLDAVKRYAQAGCSSGINIEVVQEQLYWVMYLLGYVLADPAGRGEMPCVPSYLINLSLNTPKEQPDPLIQAVEPLFAYVEFENRCIEADQSKLGEGVLSPLLAEIVVWFLERWSATYLMPSMIHYEQVMYRLLQTYGSDSETAHQCLEFIVRKICVNLYKWKHEPQVALKTAELMQGLVRDKMVRVELMKCKSWWFLIQRYGKLDIPIFAAPTELVSDFVNALARSAPSGDDRQSTENRVKLFEQVMKSVNSNFDMVISKPDFKKRCENNDVVHRLSICLYMLNGVVSVTGKQSADLVFTIFRRYSQPLIELVKLYSNHVADDSIPSQVFKIYNSFSNNLDYLETEQINVFFSSCFQLIQVYASHSKINFEDTNHENCETDGDHFEKIAIEIQCLLDLLSKTTIPDESFGPERNNLASKMLLIALALIIPHLHHIVELYPQLAVTFFDILSSVTIINPEKLTELQPQHRKDIFKVIVYTFCHFEKNIPKFGLYILRAVAVFHLRAGGKTPFGENLLECLRLLLETLLRGSIDLTLGNDIADALFPMILVNQSNYKPTVQYFLDKIESVETKQALGRYFTELVTANGLSTEMNSKNDGIFRKNLIQFAERARAVMHTK